MVDGIPRGACCTARISIFFFPRRDQGRSHRPLRRGACACERVSMTHDDGHWQSASRVGTREHARASPAQRRERPLRRVMRPRKGGREGVDGFKFQERRTNLERQVASTRINSGRHATEGVQEGFCRISEARMVWVRSTIPVRPTLYHVTNTVWRLTSVGSLRERFPTGRQSPL